MLPRVVPIVCHPDIPPKMIPTNIGESSAHAGKRKETETPLASCFCNFY